MGVPQQPQQPGYNLSPIYAPITQAPSVFSQSQLNSQLPNVQMPQNNGLQGMLNNFLMQQSPLGMPQGSPQQQGQGGLNNMMSFLGNMFGSGGMASGVGDALSSAGSSIASLFGL